MTITPVKRALISVSNKDALIPFARKLHEQGVEIISTGGTSQALHAANIPHRQVDELTGLPSMLSGRVKTLHPTIHGGILGKRDIHAEEAVQHKIGWIDLVVVNFYPFADAVKQTEMGWDEAVEYIDIGGPTMVRAAAKNFAWVGVLTDPQDYDCVIFALEQEGGLSEDLRRQLAEKAFSLTSNYDSMIQDYFFRKSASSTSYPSQMTVKLEKVMELRYGENPHQQACAYQNLNEKSGVLSAIQHQGKPLSYNNILDAEAALTCVREFDAPACVIVKHANPCGVATANQIDEAYARAYQADSLSAFGGIVALNRPCTKAIAEAISQIFMEVVLAPVFTDEALNIFSAKPNLRVLALDVQPHSPWEMKFITGGALWQERDTQRMRREDLQVVTQAQPSSEDLDAMLFAWRVLKHIKSNAILIAKDNMTIGIGGGQVSRIDSVDIALRKAADKSQNAILASDAFFPFRDSIDRLANTGIRAIIQPGGSVKDQEVIAACNELGIAMVFTGKRCFRH